MEVIVLHVGTAPDRESFRVHKDLLIKKAPYFNMMFNGSFKESSTQEGSFSDDEPISFKLFITWLYQDRVQGLGKAAKGNAGDGWLYRLFGLAEEYLVARLADQAMDHITSFMLAKRLYPGETFMAVAYEVTENSKLRLFITRCAAATILHHSGTSAWKDVQMVDASTNNKKLFCNVMSKLRL